MGSKSECKAGRGYLCTGAFVFASALVYYVCFRSQLPWPGNLFLLDWEPLSQLTDPSNGSYPSFAFALSMGLIAVGLFATKRTLVVIGIVGVWVVGLFHEIFFSTYASADVMAGTLGALIAVRIGLSATQNLPHSVSAWTLLRQRQVVSACSVPTQLLFTDRTKLAALLFSSLLFATGTSPYEETIGSNCQETDVNGTCVSGTINGNPVYLSYTDLRSSVKFAGPKSLTSVSRIYLYKNYLIANELNEGIHIIDNSIPSSPQKIAFIEIPGNQDIAIKDNALYADSYVDLVTLDFSNIEDIIDLLKQNTTGAEGVIEPLTQDIINLNFLFEIARVEDVFPYNARQNIPANVELLGPIDRSLGVVVGYQ